MAEFKWDDDSGDPMDGYDTDSTPSVVEPPPPTPKPTLPKIKPMAKAPAAAVVETLDELTDALEDSPDPAELTEAEWRLEKAGYYRSVINSQLLGSDHPAAIEVEQELQQWAKIQLETLLGLRTKTEGGTVVAPVYAYESPFTEDEAAILKMLAAKALSRQANPQPAVTPAPVAKEPQPIKPVPAASRPVITPVATQDTPKRGRGRPRKNPCRICGQMECGHKRQAPQPAQPQQVAPTPENTTGESYDGLPIQMMPDGTKFIEDSRGRRYRLEMREVTHKQTGKVRLAYTPIELSKNITSSTAKPYPSEQEVIQMAAVEAQRNAGAMSSLTAVTGITGAPTKFTGQDLIQAALKAPERESYIPQPPPKKRQ